LLYLAGYLEGKGFDTDVQDLTLEPDALTGDPSWIKEDPSPIVGITSYTTNVVLASRIAARVKERAAKTFVVLGGFHASAMPEKALEEFPSFDAVVYGEGEGTFAELAESIQNNGPLEEVDGLCYRKGGKICRNQPRDLIKDLDLLPFPDRDRIPLERYVPDPGNYYSLPSTGILFSRGCPFPCAYCSKSVFLNRIRYRSVNNFLDEIQDCRNRYGIQDFRFYDEGPTHSKRRVIELCEQILERDIGITWNCYSRIDAMDEEILGHMQRAGCYHIKYGIESGVPATLERIKKPTDLQRVVEICRMTRRAGIECKANFIIGFPWEGVKEMEQTIRYARQCAPDLVTFNLFKPFPGSTLYDELEQSGRLLHRSWEDYFTTSETLVFETGLSEDVYKGLLKKAWVSFYLRPGFLWQRIVLAGRNPRREAANTWTGMKFILKNLFR